MLELLQDGALGEISDPVKEALQIMSRSNRNLLEMVNKLLDVYRYEAGNKTINPQKLDLNPLIKEVIQELSPIAQTKSLFLENHLPDQPLIIQGDRLELIRVFNNLIGNALKFTDKGGVTIHSRLDHTHYHIHIQDTGIGIPAQEVPLLFQRFRQGNHHKQGSGLGLYLSHYIITAHQGQITLESQPNQGTTFCISLPKAH
jgi:signal transduction histidine kinase